MAFPYPANEFDTSAQQPMAFPAPKATQPPATTPQPETAGMGNPLGLGNNMETWLAGLQLLGGLMQPVQMGDTAGGVTGRALANAAGTFTKAKGDKAAGKREDKKVEQGDRKIDIAQNQIDADLFKDQNINDLEQAKINYYNNLGRQAKSGSGMSAADYDNALFNRLVQLKMQEDGVSELEALNWMRAQDVKNPQQTSDKAMNIEVTTRGAAAGLNEEDIVPTLTSEGVRNATFPKNPYNPVPDFSKLPAEQLQTIGAEMKNLETQQYIDQTYGPEFYRAWALQGIK